MGKREGGKTHAMRIKDYRSTLSAVEVERFVEVVAGGEEVFVVGAV